MKVWVVTRNWGDDVIVDSVWTLPEKAGSRTAWIRGRNPHDGATVTEIKLDTLNKDK